MACQKPLDLDGLLRAVNWTQLDTSRLEGMRSLCMWWRREKRIGWEHGIHRVERKQKEKQYRPVKGQHKEEEGEMSETSETGTGSPLNVDVPTQIIPFDRSPSTHERVIYKFFSSKPFFVAFSFLIMYLASVLQGINQGPGASLICMYPVNLMTFIIATVIYSFALAATMALPLINITNTQLARFVTFFSGALSVGSVVWMFLPRWLGWLIFITWFLLLVMVGYDLFHHSFQMLYQKTKEKLHNTLNRVMGQNLTEQQHVSM
ncbi:hypothetical protein L1049_018930 [Liquidambar formosana]|uniref:Uncharacterized protein n=1 Tax=Liquidambar formosana TaxID=63359 RepID=A0AAP0RAR9_LIQFO